MSTTTSHTVPMPGLDETYLFAHIMRADLFGAIKNNLRRPAQDEHLEERLKIPARWMTTGNDPWQDTLSGVEQELRIVAEQLATADAMEYMATADTSRAPGKFSPDYVAQNMGPDRRQMSTYALFMQGLVSTVPAAGYFRARISGQLEIWAKRNGPRTEAAFIRWKALLDEQDLLHSRLANMRKTAAAMLRELADDIEGDTGRARAKLTSWGLAERYPNSEAAYRVIHDLRNSGNDEVVVAVAQDADFCRREITQYYNHARDRYDDMPPAPDWVIKTLGGAGGHREIHLAGQWIYARRAEAIAAELSAAALAAQQDEDDGLGWEPEPTEAIEAIERW